MDLTSRLEIMNWLTGAGLSGIAETDLVRGFCERSRAAGLELSRGIVFIDTLHPVFEGRGFRWSDVESNESDLFEYESTSEGEAAENWRRSPFYTMLQTGQNELCIDSDDEHFKMTTKLVGDGHRHFATFIHRFGDAGIIGEMDCVYSLWCMRHENGFNEDALGAMRDLVPLLGLAVKSAAHARIARTIGHVYLGRDAAERVLSGRISRGVADRINAVLWFSDLRGSTAIGEAMDPAEIIPFLNDYADAAISAIHDEGGDVLKLMGDGVLAIFNEDDMAAARRCARRTSSEKTFRFSTNGARPRTGRPPRPMWACMSARCSTATSAARSGSTSPWSVRRSTRSAGSPRCAAPSSASFWCRRRFSPGSMRPEAHISSQPDVTRCAGSGGRRNCTRSILKSGPMGRPPAGSSSICRIATAEFQLSVPIRSNSETSRTCRTPPENSIRPRSRNWLRTRLTCTGVRPTASAMCCWRSGTR